MIDEQIGVVSSFGQSAPFIAGSHMICGIESLPQACAIGLPSGSVTLPAKPVISMMPLAGSLQVQPDGQGPGAPLLAAGAPPAPAVPAIAGDPALVCGALPPALAVAGAPAVVCGAALPAVVTGVAAAPAVVAGSAFAPAMVVVMVGVITAGPAVPVLAELLVPVGVAGMLGALPPATTPDGTDAATPGVPQAIVVADRSANPEATTRLVSVVVLLSLTLVLSVSELERS